jgi:hypothetical protein
MTDGPYGLRPNQPVSWFRRSLRGSNQNCLYCGAVVGTGASVPSDREHLVARNFVPPGSLDDTAFNFIFRACMECNRRKGDAERHVSSVTLLNSPGRAEDSTVDAVATHKSENDFHPGVPGVRVADAVLHRSYKTQFGPAEITFDMAGPPQLDLAAACTLACHQVQALFSLVTTQDPRDGATTTLLRADWWRYLGVYSWRDWGNVQLAELCQRVDDWPIVLRVTTANGYFRAIMRATDTTPDEWYWGLEWNKSHRMVGSIFKEDQAPDAFRDLPLFAWSQVTPKSRMRKEVPEPPGKDYLFGGLADPGSSSGVI